MKVVIKRVYEQGSKDDGYRVLVDRLWPRGIKKENLKLNEWCKDIAPSSELRQKFHSGEVGFDIFSGLYTDELTQSSAPKELLKRAAGNKTLTLLYASKEPTQNHAIVLAGYLSKL